MEHTEFFDLIKNKKLSGAYLLHGDEEYVKKSALKAVYALVESAARDMNIQSANTVDGIIAACETVPFFSDIRVVTADQVPTGDDGARLRDYIKDIPQSTVLIICVTGKADGTTAIYKALARENRAVLFDPLSRAQAVKWVVKQCPSLGVTMAENTAAFLVDIAGTDLSGLKGELQKSAAYAGEGAEVTREHISACVRYSAEYRVFDMVDCFLYGKTGDGLRALDSLLRSGESPIGMAALLSGRFKAMLSARECMDSGLKRDAAVKRMGGSPYAAGKSFDAAKRYTREQLLLYATAFSQVLSKKLSTGADEAEILKLALISCSIKG